VALTGPWTEGGPSLWVHGGPIEAVCPDLSRAVHWRSGGHGGRQAKCGGGMVKLRRRGSDTRWSRRRSSPEMLENDHLATVLSAA
jgi:hypothetical protein